MKAYYVEYTMYESDVAHGIAVPANNKIDAYDKAINELIPASNDNEYPYSAWVTSVTYNNGKVHYFNTCDGLPY